MTMKFFATQHQILFHDTMAYGSHHHSVNIKLQNTARETLLFLSAKDGQEPWQVQLKDIIMLTREAYSLNLAPAMLGEKVAVLTSYENPTRSTVRPDSSRRAATLCCWRISAWMALNWTRTR